MIFEAQKWKVDTKNLACEAYEFIYNFQLQTWSGTPGISLSKLDMGYAQELFDRATFFFELTEHELT